MSLRLGHEVQALLWLDCWMYLLSGARSAGTNRLIVPLLPLFSRLLVIVAGLVIWIGATALHRHGGFWL